ncbi:MAG: histidine phosphatase family protein [Candidatus Pacebacteria bacterium]|nr:histidine phosphatase family protein [Candidatus Paceibacterota bacterium]
MQSKTNTNGVWFVRHACSIYNLGGEILSGETKIADISKEEQDFFSNITGRFDLKFLDARLSSKGIAQAKAAQTLANKIPAKYVIVSPLARTLDTARIMFETHPHSDNIKFLVHPVIRECFEGPDDVPFWSLKTQKPKYVGNKDCPLNYDFSMMEGFDHPGMFFLETADPAVKEAVMKRVATEGEDKYPDIMVGMLSDLWDAKEKAKAQGKRVYPGLETRTNARKRARSFLVWLSRFIEEKKVKPEEVVVVTHSSFLMCLAAQKFNADGEPDYPCVENAKPFQLDINELMKHYS